MPPVTAAAPLVAKPVPALELAVVAAEPESALANFMGGGDQQSLASHCNTISLVNNTNGGFTTLASMSDRNLALNKQFCLARTYAIAKGEELIGKVQSLTPQETAAQCEEFGPAM